MKRMICYALAAILLLGGCGSSGQKMDAAPGQAAAVSEQSAAVQESSENQDAGKEMETIGEMEEIEEVTIFPKSDCFIGDTMPYFENGYMNVFYLADLRDGKTGSLPPIKQTAGSTEQDVPWSLLFCTFLYYLALRYSRYSVTTSILGVLAITPR